MVIVDDTCELVFTFVVPEMPERTVASAWRRFKSAALTDAEALPSTEVAAPVLTFLSSVNVSDWVALLMHLDHGVAFNNCSMHISPRTFLYCTFWEKDG